MILRILYHYAKTRFLAKFLSSRQQLSHFQQKQFKRLIKGSLVHCPYYQDYLNKPLDQWPIMDKKTMMENFNELNTVKISKSQALAVALQAEASRNFTPMIADIAVGLSSGTSGQRGLFLVSPKERDAWVGILLAKALPGGLWQKERIAFFLRANNQLYMNLSQHRKIQFYFFDLLDDFNQQIEELNRIKPTILSAPASVLVALAKEKSRLKIRPAKIFSVAEVLDDQDENLIQQAFNCPVSQVYQCTEGFLAISDPSNRLLLNEEHLIIEKEWLDEHRFIPIITDLLRSTQPIIRYRLDDVLIEERSTGIFTQLSKIEGRVGDICYAQKNNAIEPLFADVLRQHLAAFPNKLDDYQIKQQSINEFSIQVCPEFTHKEALIEHLNQLFDSKHCEKPQWLWEDWVPKEKGAKQRRIQCCFDADQLEHLSDIRR